MSTLEGFNRIAPWYDFLKRIVFGPSITSSQVRFLPTLPIAGDFLVLGGGSGEILNPLLKDRPTARVWYVEASSAMIDLARKNISGDREGCVRFMHGTEDILPGDQKFDGVITHFFLDMFPDAHLKEICLRISSQLKDSGLWLVSDFDDGGKTWQRLMLWLMYRFFVLTSRVSATRLPQWEDALQAGGLRKLDTASFYHNFIKSCIYTKVVNTHD